MSPEYSIQTSTFCALVSPSSRQISATSSGASLSRTKAGTSTITAVTSSMSFIALVTCVQKTRGTTSTLSCATSRSEKVAAPSPPYDQTTAGPSQMFTPTSPSEPSTEQALLSYSPPSIPSSQRTVHIASVTNLSLPSWVPDWRILPLHLIGSPETPHRATGDTKPRLDIDEQAGMLHIVGRAGASTRSPAIGGPSTATRLTCAARNRAASSRSGTSGATYADSRRTPWRRSTPGVRGQPSLRWCRR